MVEELGIAYDLKPVNIFEGDQLVESFADISPNRRIPALVDTDGPAGKRIRVFESGAVLLYLAEKFGSFLPKTPHGRMTAMQWLMWQVGGLGPMFGQAQHFFHYATDKHPYSLDRYTRESARLLSVMDRHLAAHEFLADEYSIADMACFPWVRVHKLAGLSIEGLPNVGRWYGAIRARAAVDRGMNILREHLTGVPNKPGPRAIMFGDGTVKSR
jgi:GST-like protein